MEEFPSLVPEAKPSDGKDKKKKRAKRTNLRLPALASLENGHQDKSGAKPETTPLNEALAGLMEKKKPETDHGVKEKLRPSEKRPTPEIAVPTAEVSEDTEGKAEAADKAEAYEELPGYQPEPVEFSGGEVIIHLQGDEPVAERIIPLHAEDEPEAEPKEKPLFQPPTFTPPAEQRRQEQVESPESAVAGGGEVPPTQPPEAPPTPFEQPPEPPRPPAGPLQPRPEDIYTPPTVSSPDITQTSFGGEQLVTKKEAEDAAYYAARAAQNRGVATGLLVGGAYEHFKHKRREKRQEKRFKQQSKQLQEARQNYDFGLQEQARSDQRIETLERQLGAEKRFENQARPEKLPQAVAKRPKPDPSIERLPAIPADHRLETSAWHSIEVDSKTGKAVENPAFEYGHEYYRERAAEATPKAQLGAAAGEVALVAAAGTALPASASTPALPSPHIPDATTQGSRPAGRSQNTSSGQDQVRASSPAVSTGPLWPWLLALTVVVICLVLVAK